MIVRPETPADYAAIADVHARAFDNRTTEPLIVTLLRQRRDFDPDLSLVAEIEGSIVGHVLFFPYRLHLMGNDVSAVNLAPIGVLPGYQRQGIGSRLINEGHRVAQRKGYVLSFLLGHTSYYPRLGYRTGAFGVATASVAAAILPKPCIHARAVIPEDIPSLHSLWEIDHAAVDFALDPGHSYLDWVSPNPAIRSLVYERDGQLVGYTRIHRDEPAAPRVFLAADPAASEQVAAHLAAETAEAALTLPIHPASAAASAFAGAEVRRWQSAMANSLRPGALDPYLAALDAGTRPAGQVTWPVAFDL